MSTVTDTTTDANGNIITNVSSSTDDSIALATAGTYFDKNIIFNLAIQKDAAEPVLQEKSVTPSIMTQEIIPDSGYDGLSKVSVSGDANLVARNIKNGVNIFGVIGSYEGSSSGGIQEVDGIGEIIKNAYISSGENVGNEYISPGDIIPYNGWSVSKWYPCLENDYIILNKLGMHGLQYSSISDSNFNHLSRINVTSANDIIISTENARYMRFSESSAIINSLRVFKLS